jgi:hypothetical protein
VSLTDLSAGADVETTHGRVTLLNVCGAVAARAVNGIVDYSGHEGSIRLYADWGINLNLDSAEFDGKLTAIAEGPVRVLLPSGFSTPFEARTAKDAAFICRADIREQILRREENGPVIYTFGEGPPRVRLFSLKGPIVIDNAASPYEEAVEHAMQRPRPPVRSGHIAVDPHFQA